VLFGTSHHNPAETRTINYDYMSWVLSCRLIKEKGRTEESEGLHDWLRDRSLERYRRRDPSWGVDDGCRVIASCGSACNTGK
jgi:hypothetical protein